MPLTRRKGAGERGVSLFLRSFRKAFGLRCFKMFERQWRPRLERLDCDVASYFAHNWQIEEFADQKALVAGEIRYDDFQEVIGLAGDEVARNNLWHRHDGFLERQCALVGVSVELDAQKDREAKTDAIAPQGCAITFNVPVPFQTLDATQARRWRQADLVSQFDVAQTSIGLQLRNYAAIDRIKIWHNATFQGSEKADHCYSSSNISAFCKDLPRYLMPRSIASAPNERARDA